ncbi:MAG: Cof-type HAD-IIB family hydrolase [Eubacteriales bacterium]|nr:Cof-type HAD-IIB family hydrolase [Eubacteriales bacterium]
MEKKALFLDMDGTTLDDQVQVPEGNKRAIRQAIQAGHEVVVTTGRPMASARMLLERWGLDRLGCRYVIAFNGGMVLDALTGELLYEKTMPLAWMRRIAEEAKRADVYVQTYEGELVLTDQDGESLRHYLNKNRMKAKIVPDLLTGMTREACKFLAIDLSESGRLQAFCDGMKEWSADKLDLYYSSGQYLEIMPKGVCKGAALEAFCRSRGIAIENSVAAGDEYNDISMLRAAGTGCAVANARPEVKAAADYVTQRDNNHAAIEEIIGKFML